MAIDDTEEMMAVKKVYADMILNTTKEAAVRVMAAECKAQKYEKELVSTKEEAVRMLLRLKQMIDTQKKEAETTSLNEQMRITELEAQLDEAEGVIIDLRAKLSYLEDKLERVKDKYKRSLSQKEIAYPPNHSNTPMDVQSYFPFPYSFSEPASVLSEVQVSLPKPSILVHQCITTQENIASPNPTSVDPCPTNGVSFSTIQSKEPELDNNKCGQTVEGSETITLLKPSTCEHECIASSKEISVASPVFVSGPSDNQEPELQKKRCSQRVQGSEAISLLKPSILVHKTKTLPKEISRSSSGCDLDSVRSPGSTSATTESLEPYKKEFSQRSVAVESCLPADKLCTAQETKSLPKSGPRTKKKRRNGKTKALSCLRTEKSGGKDGFVRQAVVHNGITAKDQPVKVHKLPRRSIRYGRLKTAFCKRRSARIVMHQQTSVAIARSKSSVSGNVCKSDDTPIKATKSVSKVECASRLNEKLQPQKFHGVSIVRRSNRNKKIKHCDDIDLPLRTSDALEDASSLNDNLVECQVRLCEDVSEIRNNGKTHAGIRVKIAFTNAGTLDENSTCGDFGIEDSDLIDVLITDQQNTFPSQMKLENTCIIPADYKLSESTEAPRLPEPNRTIIHTFSRKRKNRSSLVQLDETNPSGECPLKKHCGEGNDIVLISGNRDPANKSSSDCRQSLQVAHQACS